MKIVIVGAGIVGTTLTRQLSREGHDLYVVDHNAANVKRLNDQVDAMVVHGSGCSPTVLKKAGAEGADMLIAVTDSDETNIVSCLLAKKFGVKRKIARLRSVELTGGEMPLPLAELGIDLAVNPNEVMVDTLTKLLRTPDATDVAEFADGKVLLRGFHVEHDAPIVGKSLAELREASTLEAFLIAAIARNGTVIIPKGTDRIQTGDTIYVLVSEETLPLFLHFISRTMPKLKRVVVYDGGETGRGLAVRLQDTIDDVVYLEPNEELARQAAEVLTKATVLRGEGTDVGAVHEARIEEADAFVALAADDRANLAAALLARKAGARRVAVQTLDPDFVPIVHSIGINIVLNPRLIAVSAILQFVRRGKVWSVFKMAESEAEVLEMEPMPGSKVVGKPLREIAFPEGAIVGAVMQDGFMHIPDGNTVLRSGERAVIFTLPEAIPRLEKLFSKRKH